VNAIVRAVSRKNIGTLTAEGTSSVVVNGWKLIVIPSIKKKKKISIIAF
jgi:hypothetical protein